MILPFANFHALPGAPPKTKESHMPKPKLDRRRMHQLLDAALLIGGSLGTWILLSLYQAWLQSQS